MKQRPDKIFNKDRDNAIMKLHYRVSSLEKVVNALIHHVSEYIKWTGHGEKFTKYQEKKLEERGMVEEKQEAKTEMDNT
jgi:hypothetical protein